MMGIEFAAAWLLAGGAVASLPRLPTAPQLEIAKYPECKSESSKFTARLDKFSYIQSCISQTEQFNQFYLKRFPQTIANYSSKITIMELKFSKSLASLEEKSEFHDLIVDEIDKCKSIKDGVYGDYYRDYYLYLQKYRDDMILLIKMRKDVQILY